MTWPVIVNGRLHSTAAIGTWHHQSIKWTSCIRDDTFLFFIHLGNKYSLFRFGCTGLTFSLLSQLYCFGASSVLLPRGTALHVVVVSTVVVVGVQSSFSDFLLDFFEKKHPIFYSTERRSPVSCNASLRNETCVCRSLWVLHLTRFFFVSRFLASCGNQSVPWWYYNSQSQRSITWRSERCVLMVRSWTNETANLQSCNEKFYQAQSRGFIHHILSSYGHLK